MGVTHHIIAFFTRDEEQFGVNFQPRRGEDDMYARFGEPLRPVNVGLFIEARL